MGRYRRDEETHFFEGKVEFTSAKAWLVEMTLGGKYWVPKSQVVSRSDADEDGNCQFEVSNWWWGVKEPVDEQRN